LATLIEANLALADLLEWYRAQRIALCAKVYNNPPLTTIWSFAPYDNSSNKQVAATLTAWLLEAYIVNAAAPPPGLKWTPHNLRKRAASAASCIGAPLYVVKYMGGWPKNNALIEGKYIDPTMNPSPSAWWYFGWLVSSRPLHYS
jgi:hypothetical protein